MTTLGIVGAGGHGREAHAIATAAPTLYSGVVFADDGEVDAGALARLGGPAVVPISDVTNHCDRHVIAIGDPTVRRSVAERIASPQTADVLTAPTATVGTDVECAGGVMVYPGAVLTTNIRVGHHSHVNCGAIISHDCRVGAFVSISPGVLLNGAVIIEDDVFLGSGAIVLPGRRVGQGAVVGAGAVVTTDVAPGATVVGVPAR